MTNALFNVILTTIIIIVIYIIVGSVLTLIINKGKGFKKQFQIFNKRIDIDFSSEYMLTTLKKLDGYKRIIKYNGMFILFHQKGIWIIKGVKYDNKIQGDIKEDFLTNRVSLESIDQVPNFFKELDELTNKIQKQINEPIQKLIVKKEICLFEIKVPLEYKIISKTNCLYTLNNLIKENDQHYTKEQIKNLINKIH